MKLSRFGPEFRTVFIASIVLLALAIGVNALGAEIKVTDVDSLRACVSGNAIPAGSSSPDVGRTAAPGDTCVVFDGVYDLGEDTPLVVSVENLIVRSMNGATATIITGEVDGALVNIIVRGVTFGGPAADQGFTVTNTAGDTGIGLCVTDPGVTGAPCFVPEDGYVITPTGAGIAQENITIQNNRFLGNGGEGVVFWYNNTTAIDTIRILRNTFIQNGGSGLVFGSTVGAIGRRGMDRNVVIDGNTFDLNVQGDAANFPDDENPDTLDDCDLQPANIHFCNTGTIEQLGIVNNRILRAGVVVLGPQADGIVFDQGILEIRDTIISYNVIHQNTRNGIKFDYAGRLGENVEISHNREGVQGITQNGPAPALLPAEGNGIYITSRVTEVRGIKFVDNVINGNRGQFQDVISEENYKPCRDGNGISMENSGRIEDVLFEGNDFRQNFNNGVCIANRGDFSRSQVLKNKFHNNGFGEPIATDEARQAPYGDGFGVYHDQTLVNPGSDNDLGIDGFRIENITFSGNDYRENGRHIAIIDNGTGTFFGLGFGVHLRAERQEISRITFENEMAMRNRLGGFRLETDTDSPTVRSGDIREITWTNVKAIESQGDPQRGGIGSTDADVAAEINDNGDGIAMITDNGDVGNIKATNVEASNNGGAGFRIESDATGGKDSNADGDCVDTDDDAGVGDACALNRAGDLSEIELTNGAFNYNGERAALGNGNGITIRTAVDGSVRNVKVTGPLTGSNNNDHGALIAAARNVGNVTVENATFENNDRNRDTVGDGVQITANEDLSQITVRGVTANSNYGGIRIGAAGRQIAQSVTVENNTANDNVKEGIALYAGRDMITVKALGNTLLRNGFGIDITVIQRGTGIEVANNLITGKDGAGTGILMNGTNITVHDNAIRRAETGIEVRKAAGCAINSNNISRNEKYGVDASALQPGESIDATNNWWGEPSGPKHVTNPGGIGDRVTDKVNFKPFLGEPVCTTPLICPSYFFTIKSFTGPSEAQKGVSVKFTAEIQNTGTEEGSQEITLTVIKKASGEVVGVKSVTKTINPAASTTVTFDFTFTQPGSYTVKLTTQDDSKSIDVTVPGVPLLTIEQAVAQHSGNPTIIEDPDIIWAVELWVEDTIVPGTDGLRIDDAKILELVGMWIEGTPVAMAAGQAAQQPQQKKGFNLFNWLMSFFAARPAAAVEINPQASPSRVAPGEAFTVTVEVGGEVKGLLLAAELPQGWTITPLENGPAFYKPSEQKWLMLGAGTLAYKVTVPAEAAPGSYTVLCSYRTAEGEGVKALTVEVEGAPAALKVEAVKFTGSRFLVEGLGIASVEARVWNLAGSLVFHGSASGNALSVAAPLANGVYLYAVTIKGADGQVVQTEVRKLVVLR